LLIKKLQTCPDPRRRELGLMALSLKVGEGFGNTCRMGENKVPLWGNTIGHHNQEVNSYMVLMCRNFNYYNLVLTVAPNITSQTSVAMLYLFLQSICHLQIYS
jgi:hypothetical protein